MRPPAQRALWLGENAELNSLPAVGRRNPQSEIRIFKEVVWEK